MTDMRRLANLLVKLREIAGKGRTGIDMLRRQNMKHLEAALNEAAYSSDQEKSSLKLALGYLLKTEKLYCRPHKL